MDEEIVAYTSAPVGPDEAARVQLLQGADYDSIKDILATCPGLNLEPNQVLVAPGNPCQALHVVIAGRLRIHRDSPNSNPIGTAETGESLGDLSIANKMRASRYVIADQRSRVLVMDEDRLLELVNKSHVVARNYLFSLIRHLRAPDDGAIQIPAMQEKFQRYSLVDELTGLHNRRWLEDMLSRQILRSATDKRPLSILLVDVDRFKEFEREFGEAAGRQTLHVVAQTLVRKARPTDLVAHFEHDRFVLVLPDTDAAGAHVLAQRLCSAVGETRIEIPNECILPPVTVSIGIARMTAFVGAKKLLSDALVASGTSKAQGGNCVSTTDAPAAVLQAMPNVALADATGN